MDLIWKVILDEPTNHLDFQTVEALTQALMNYEGTVAVVSHDRSFIRRVGTKILEVNHGQVSVYPGAYDEYVWSLEKGVLSQRGQPINEKNPLKKIFGLSKEDHQENPDSLRERRKNIDKKIKQADKNLDSIDNNLLLHQEKLSLLNDQIANGKSANLPQAILNLAEIQLKIENFEEEWLKITDVRDQLLEELNQIKG